jgi:hypothetical protein
MREFDILITCPPDRNNLVAEIWYAETLVAEINQETEMLEIEFYLTERTIFNLSEFLEVLEKAKNKLMAK